MTHFSGFLLRIFIDAPCLIDQIANDRLAPAVLSYVILVLFVISWMN